MMYVETGRARSRDNDSSKEREKDSTGEPGEHNAVAGGFASTSILSILRTDVQSLRPADVA